MRCLYSSHSGSLSLTVQPKIRDVGSTEQADSTDESQRLNAFRLKLHQRCHKYATHATNGAEHGKYDAVDWHTAASDI